MFGLIKDIDIDIEESWRNYIFITIDIDWAPDEIILYTINLLEKYNAKATFFITHKTYLLKKIIENPNFDIGIHPNFNFLLDGDYRYGKSISEVIMYFNRIVPDTLSVRSHALTQSSIILNKIADMGFKYELNTYIPFHSGSMLCPYRHCGKDLIRVPHFWEDDAELLYKSNIKLCSLLNYEGIKVFDFHPIHIFLNTEDMNRYEKAKKFFKRPKSLFHFQNKEKYGTGNFLEELCNFYI